jgi:hypothetical protein
MSKPSLEQRIAAALTPADITSTDLAALIAEVEGAAQAADENATRAREEALDPAVVVDTAKVGAAVVTAELTRDRLQAALLRLRTRYTEVREQEGIAAWKADAEELEVRRVALAVEFYKLLPPELLKQIAERLHAMRAFDREIDALNHRRPDDRSVRPLDYATPELARELKLPDPDKPSQFLWPPPQPNLALQMIAAIRPDPFIISEAAKGTYIDARNKRILEDNRRQIEEAEQRQREFEERQRKELKSAKERDRQAYRERGWPSG